MFFEYKNNIHNISDLLILGRSDKNFKIDDNLVSSKHIQFSIKDGQYFILDLNSTNGTFLNNSKIESQKPYLIEHNSKIVIGSTEILIKSEDTSEKSVDSSETLTSSRKQSIELEFDDIEDIVPIDEVNDSKNHQKSKEFNEKMVKKITLEIDDLNATKEKLLETQNVEIEKQKVINDNQNILKSKINKLKEEIDKLDKQLIEPRTEISRIQNEINEIDNDIKNKQEKLMKYK